MPDPSRRNLLSDIELVELAQSSADKNNRVLRHIKDDTTKDAVVYEDRVTGIRRTLPNKFIRAIGKQATFELVDPNLA